MSFFILVNGVSWPILNESLNMFLVSIRYEIFHFSHLNKGLTFCVSNPFPFPSSTDPFPSLAAVAPPLAQVSWTIYIPNSSGWCHINS